MSVKLQSIWQIRASFFFVSLCLRGSRLHTQPVTPYLRITMILRGSDAAAAVGDAAPSGAKITGRWPQVERAV
jgi:hypothetical protein